MAECMVHGLQALLRRKHEAVVDAYSIGHVLHSSSSKVDFGLRGSPVCLRVAGPVHAALEHAVHRRYLHGKPASDISLDDYVFALNKVGLFCVRLCSNGRAFSADALLAFAPPCK